MPVTVILYSVYVEGEGVSLFNQRSDAVKYQENFQGSSVTVWGLGKHVVEVTNCIEYQNPEDYQEN